MTSPIQRLNDAVEAVCPIDGLYVPPGPAGTWGDPATVRIDFASTATQPQMGAARAVVAGWDFALRTPRPLNAIIADLNNLSGPQKANVQTDFFATHTYDQTADDEGIRLAGIVGRATGIDAGTVNKLKFYAVAVYLRLVDTRYLVHPAFDLTINVPGDA